MRLVIFEALALRASLLSEELEKFVIKLLFVLYNEEKKLWISKVESEWLLSLETLFQLLCLHTEWESFQLPYLYWTDILAILLSLQFSGAILRG